MFDVTPNEASTKMWYVSYRDLRVKCKLKLGEKHSSLNQMTSSIIMIVEQTMKSIFGESKPEVVEGDAPQTKAEVVAMKNKFMGMLKGN